MVRLSAIFLVIMVGTVTWLGIGSEEAEAEAVKEAGLRMIIVKDRKAAESIRKQLLNGASFSALARAKSIGPQRRQWGFSGVLKLDDAQDELRPVLKRLKLGQVSQVVELNQTYAILKLIPAQITPLLATAEQELRGHKPEPAIKALQKVLKLEPDNVPAHLMLGLAYGENKQYIDSVKLLEKAESYAPREAQIQMLLGVMYTQAAAEGSGKAHAQKALKAYDKALSLNKRLEPAVELGIGKTYITALKQPEKGLKHLQKAAALTPDMREVHGMLIQTYYDMKRYEKAWKQLRFAQSKGFEFPKLTAALHKVKKSR